MIRPASLPFVQPSIVSVSGFGSTGQFPTRVAEPTWRSSQPRSLSSSTAAFGMDVRGTAPGRERMLRGGARRFEPIFVEIGTQTRGYAPAGGVSCDTGSIKTPNTQPESSRGSSASARESDRGPRRTIAVAALGGGDHNAGGRRQRLKGFPRPADTPWLGSSDRSLALQLAAWQRAHP